jgi:hypothetical protein
MKKNEIAKSSLLIQKEKELKELQKKRDKITKSIKSTKAKIEEWQTSIDTATKEMMNGMARMADLSKLAKDLKTMLKDLKKKVKLSKKDKAELDQVFDASTLDEMADDVDDAFARTPFGSAEGFENGRFDNEDQFTDEFNRQRRQHMFEPFAVKPNDVEQQAIRKVFVGLAGRFHPDKAETEAESKLFHDLMQSINNAYQRGDMAELLDIKTRFAAYQTSDAGTSDYDIPILDVLDEQILRCRNEVSLLDAQIVRLKAEFKNLKDSDLGTIVKQNKQAERFGDGGTSDLQDGTMFMFDMLTELKNVLNQWIETGKKPMVFNQFVDGSHPIVQQGRKDGMVSFGFDDDDDDDGMNLELSEEELMELMDMFSGMMEKSAPRKRTKRR